MLGNDIIYHEGAQFEAGPTMATELRMRPQFIARVALQLAQAMPPALEAAVQIVSPTLPHSAKVLATRLKNFVLSTTAKLAARVGQ